MVPIVATAWFAALVAVISPRFAAGTWAVRLFLYGGVAPEDAIGIG